MSKPGPRALLKSVHRAGESPEHRAASGIQRTLDFLGRIAVDDMVRVELAVEEGLGDIKTTERPVESGTRFPGRLNCPD